jgi:hypothetical protein
METLPRISYEAKPPSSPNPLIIIPAALTWNNKAKSNKKRTRTSQCLVL